MSDDFASRLEEGVAGLITVVSSASDVGQSNKAISVALKEVNNELATIRPPTTEAATWTNLHKLGQLVKTSVLPSIRTFSAVADAQTQIIASQQASISYLASEAYAKEIREATVAAVVSSGGRGKVARVQVPGPVILEVKRVYHRLCGKAFKFAGTDGDDHWIAPKDDPENGGTESALVGDEFEDVSRPNFDDFSLPYSQRFHNKVIKTVMDENKELDRAMVELQSRRQFETVGDWLKRHDEKGNLLEVFVDGTVHKKVMTRATELLTKMQLNWASSPVSKCNLAAILHAAIFDKPNVLQFRAYSAGDSNIAGEVRGEDQTVVAEDEELGDDGERREVVVPGPLLYDSFHLYREKWQGHFLPETVKRQKQKDGGDRMFVIPEWWSDDLLRAFWVLYYAVISNSPSITPHFLPPNGICPPLRLKDLPLPLLPGAPPAKRAKRNQAMEKQPETRFNLHRAYLSSAIHADPEFAAYISSIPESSPSDGTSLESLLKDDESEEGKARLKFVNKRMAPREKVNKRVLELWWQKRQVLVEADEEDEYTKFLMDKNMMKSLIEEARIDPTLA